MAENASVRQQPTAETYREAKAIIRTATYGALAVLEPGSGAPLASRVGVSSDCDGTPVILISRLSAHTRALLADQRCSLLLGEPGRGDPLAHPRIGIAARAVEIGREASDHGRIEARYLSHQPKAKLYVGLGDFRFFRLEPLSASFNGGFGRAYDLNGADLLSPAYEDLVAAEMDAIAHMNTDHAEAVGLYARYHLRAADGRWSLAGIDAEGMELTDGERMRRVFFPVPVTSAAELRAMLVAMAKQAREGHGE